MSLDGRVSQAVYQARLLERAAHDPGPWFVAIGGHVAPATRRLTDTAVVFLADLPASDSGLELRCRDEIVSYRVSTPDIGPCEVEWVVGLADPVAA